MGLSKIQIIEETVAYYGENPAERRATGEYSCMYVSDTGAMCAVGRCLSNPTLIEQMVQEVEDDGVAGVYRLNKALNNTFDSYLKEEYQGHEEKFWFDLQFFHDTEEHWNLEENKGLSEYGIKEYEELKLKYSDKE